MQILVDSSVWINYFRSGKKSAPFVLYTLDKHFSLYKFSTDLVMLHNFAKIIYIGLGTTGLHSNYYSQRVVVKKTCKRLHCLSKEADKTQM